MAAIRIPFIVAHLATLTSFEGFAIRFQVVPAERISLGELVCRDKLSGFVNYAIRKQQELAIRLHCEPINVLTAKPESTDSYRWTA